jgi:hypothetical protein
MTKTAQLAREVAAALKSGDTEIAKALNQRRSR